MYPDFRNYPPSSSGIRVPYTQARARALYERGLAIQQELYGPASAGLLGLLGDYAGLLDKLNDVDKAAEVRARMNSISAARR